jgi:hypothetical protein
MGPLGYKKPAGKNLVPQIYMRHDIPQPVSALARFLMNSTLALSRAIFF